MWVRDTSFNVAYETNLTGSKVHSSGIFLKCNDVIFACKCDKTLFEVLMFSMNLMLLLVPVFSVYDGPVFNFPPFNKLSGMTTLSAVGLGFLLALLIFIDQNIVISLTHVPEHK